jgi:hypothetical protein
MESTPADTALDAVILKSDNYAPYDRRHLTNVVIAPLASAGDTKGMILQGVGAPIAKIQVSKVNISGAASWGIQVQGTSNVNAATDLTFSDIVIDYLSRLSQQHLLLPVRAVCRSRQLE